MDRVGHPPRPPVQRQRLLSFAPANGGHVPPVSSVPPAFQQWLRSMEQPSTPVVQAGPSGTAEAAPQHANSRHQRHTQAAMARGREADHSGPHQRRRRRATLTPARRGRAGKRVAKAAPHGAAQRLHQRSPKAAAGARDGSASAPNGTSRRTGLHPDAVVRARVREKTTSHEAVQRRLQLLPDRTAAANTQERGGGEISLCRSTSPPTTTCGSGRCSPQEGSSTTASESDEDDVVVTHRQEQEQRIRAC